MVGTTNVLSGPIEIIAAGVGGTVLGAGLAAGYAGRARFGEATMIVVAGSVAGGALPIPFGSVAGGIAAGMLVAGLPMEAAAVIAGGAAAGAMLGLMAGVAFAGKVNVPPNMY